MKKPCRPHGSDVLDLILYRVTSHTQSHIDSLKHKPTDNSMLKYSKQVATNCLMEGSVQELLAIYEDFYGEIREYNMNISNGSTDVYTGTKNWLQHVVEMELAKQYA